MAKKSNKSQGKAHPKKSNSVKKASPLANQYRGEAAPPMEGQLYPEDIFGTADPRKTKDMRHVAKEWFKNAKDIGTPGGGFLGVSDETIDPKQFAHCLDKK